MQGLVALLLAAAAMAGCLDANVDQPAAAVNQPEGNVWEIGLADFYETPSHARVRAGPERVADLAPGGDPRFAGFDAAMTAFMQAEQVAAGQLAVMHEGRLIYTTGYGHTKPDGAGQADGQTLFRIASVTKPMTHALVALQVEQGLYNWTDPVFCLPAAPASNCRIPLAPHPNHPVVDQRIADITVAHLVAHEGGWGRTTDYLYRAEGTEKIRDALGSTNVPTRWQGAQYLMGIELPIDPGTYEYCNVCYMLASLVAEAATGAQIGALFEAYLFRPLEVSGDIELGKPFPTERNPREPFYETDYERPSAYDPDAMVPGADGGFNIEMLAATGGLVATAAAVAAIYEAYPEYIPSDTMLSLSGFDPYSQYDLREHTGLLDGTLGGSNWAHDKSGQAGTIQFVYLFNNGSPSRSCGETEDVPVVGDEVDLVGCSILALKGALLNEAIAKAIEQALS